MTEKEAAERLIPELDEYVAKVHNLMSGVFRVSVTPKSYAHGVKDGAENMIVPAFNAGARAMYKILKEEL